MQTKFIEKSLIFTFLILSIGYTFAEVQLSPEISGFVMPVSESMELSALEIVLVVNDVNNPGSSTPEYIVKMLKELGVNSTVNFTYTWRNPEGLLLIDSRLYRFPSNKALLEKVLGIINQKGNEDLAQVQGIGDAAVMYKNQTIWFVSNDLMIVLSTISDDIDLKIVAKIYAEWLSAKW